VADGAHELRAFAVELGKVASGALDDVDAVTKKAADNLKKDYASEAAKSQHFHYVAPAWSYDRHYRVGSVSYEVGPDKDRAPGGALANLYYFGAPRGGGGTGDIDGPLDREEPRMMKALDDLLGRML